MPIIAEQTSRCDISRAGTARDSHHWTAQLTVETVVAVTTAVGRSTKKIINGTDIKPKPKPKSAWIVDAPNTIIAMNAKC